MIFVYIETLRKTDDDFKKLKIMKNNFKREEC